MLDRRTRPAVVIAVGRAQVVGIFAARRIVHPARGPVGGQDVIVVEYGHVVLPIAGQPVLHQPVVKGAGVRRALCGRAVGIVGVRALAHGRRGDDHKELVLTRAQVGQQVVVDRLGVGHRHLLVWLGERRVARRAIQVRIGEARLEEDDLVLAAGIGRQARPGAIVPDVLAALVVQRLGDRRAVGTGEPLGPVGDVRPTANALRSPAIVGGAHIVVAIAQGDAQPAVGSIPVRIGEPVPTGGMVDKDQLDRGGGLARVIGRGAGQVTHCAVSRRCGRGLWRDVR